MDISSNAAPRGLGLRRREVVIGSIASTILAAVALLAAAPSASASGASLVDDIVPGQRASSPRQFTNVGGTTFFVAEDPSHGRELWRTDGTAAGTKRVRDINPGEANGAPSGLTNFGGTLFFSATDGVHRRQLWSSDGTYAGTRPVREMGPRPLDPHELTSVGHTLFFAATDGVHGYELWRSDGTGAGTKLVRDIAPGGANAYPGELTSVGGRLLFTADDGIHGYELWRSDGTAAGTQIVVDIDPPGGPDGAGSDPRELTEVGGTLFFVVLSEGAGSPFGDNLDELWRSDGTAAGTKLVRRVGPDPTDPAYPLRWWPPSELTSVGSTLFFEVSDDTHGIEPWRSDGTAAGTRLVRDIYPGLNPIRGSRNNPAPPRELTNVAGTLYFTAYEPTHGYELWRSDGTWKGTRIVRDILPGSQPDSKTRTPEEFTAVGRTLFFVADDGVHGRELWSSDGTYAGTKLVRDIAPDSGFSRMPRQLASIAGRLFFNADDGLNGRELWRATP